MKGLPRTIMTLLISSILGVVAITLILELGNGVAYAFNFDLFGIIGLFVALVMLVVFANEVVSKIR